MRKGSSGRPEFWQCAATAGGGDILPKARRVFPLVEVPDWPCSGLWRPERWRASRRPGGVQARCLRLRFFRASRSRCSEAPSMASASRISSRCGRTRARSLSNSRHGRHSTGRS